MKKCISIILSVLILSCAFGIYTSAEAGNESEYSCLHSMYVLSEKMLTPDENNCFFGTQCEGYSYPEFIGEKNMSEDRYFTSINFKSYDRDGKDIEELKELIKCQPDVIDVWYSEAKTDEYGRLYSSREITLQAKILPELKNIDENGLYSIFGVDCLAIRYVEELSYNNYYIVLYLPENANEAELTRLLKDDENVVSASLSFIGSIAAPTVPDDTELGDVNENGVIDSMDYALIKRAYFGTYDLSDTQLKAADINKNGIIDAMDYLLVKRAYYNGEAELATRILTEDMVEEFVECYGYNIADFEREEIKNNYKYIGKLGEYDVFEIMFGGHPDVIYEYYVGDYLFTGGSGHLPYYLYKGHQFIRFEKAIEDGLVDLESAYELFKDICAHKIATPI